MLTPMQTRNTARELQENFRRLNINLDSALSDLQISREELNRVLTMNRPDPRMSGKSGIIWRTS